MALLIASLNGITLTEPLWASAEDAKAPTYMVLDGKASPRSIPRRRLPQNGHA